MKRHGQCAKGAAVRIDGTAPAQVRAVYVDAATGKLRCECVITGRRTDKAYPFHLGSRVYVDAVRCVPRDLVYRQRWGTRWGGLAWPAFPIVPTGMYDDVPSVVDSTHAVRPVVTPCA